MPRPDSPEDFMEDDQPTEQMLRLERFKALGGGVPLQQELRNLKRLENGEKVTLKDNVTPGHRELVSDLAAAGLSHAAIAKIFGISQTYLEDLFEYELGTAFEFAEANLGRSLYFKGLAGSESAAIAWLRYHHRSKWRSKNELTGKDGGPVDVDVKHNGKSLEEAKAWLGKMVTGMMVDKDLVTSHRPHIPGKNLKVPSPKSAKKSGSTFKKPKEDEDEADE